MGEPSPLLNSTSPPIKELSGTLFRLPLPDGWVDRSVYCAGGPIAEGFQSSVTVTLTHEPELTEFQAFVDRQLENLQRQLDDFKLQERGEDSIGGRPAPWIQFSWTSPEKVPLRQIQWYLRSSPNIVILTATAHQAAFDEHRPIIEAAIKRFLLQGVGRGQKIR